MLTQLKTQSKIALACALILPQLGIANPSLAEVRMVTGASLGYSNFSFPEKLDQEISFPSISIPVTVAADKWQLSANLQTTLSDAQISEEEDVGQASRDDLDLTLGYRLSNNWTIFGGYKYGTTDVQFTPRDADDEDEPIAITNESYEQEGPFIGASYSWQFERAGNLSFTLAYARLDAINDFSANTDEEEEDDEPVEFDDITGRVEGNTNGFSYSLSWTMPVSSNLVFQTRFKVNDYKQDIVFDNVEFSGIDERFTSLHVGLAYVF
jgi:hypothetical protein